MRLSININRSMPVRKGGAGALSAPLTLAAMSIAPLRTIVPLFFLFSVPTAFAGPLDKAFAALEVHNYFLARDLFQKQVKKHPAAAWYGLSVISGKADNPFFGIDSCYAFIMRSDAAFTAAADKERSYVAKYGVDHTAIETQKNHVFELAWEVAKGVNSIPGYDRYVRTYLNSPRAQEASLVRDHLAFVEARELNTAGAYKNFIDRYPAARELYEARSRFSEAVYREATQDRSMASFDAFVQKHPESPYIRNAEEEIFRLATPGRTAAEYRKFISDHPANHKVEDAWRAIYDLYTRDLSTGSITRFLQDFPDYPFVEELVDDYKTASLVMLPFRRDGKWGFIDDEGTERVKAQYEWVEPFQGGQALVGLNDRVGTINRSGRVVVPIEYDEVADFVQGTATVDRAGHVGAVDRAGELVVPMKYEDIGEFSVGLAYASKGGVYGYINPRGEEMVPFQFTSAGTFKNGLAVIEMNGRFGAIDARGNVVVPPQYDWIEGFDRTVSRVRGNDRFGIISPFGDVLLPVKYNHIGPFMDGLALVVEEGKCGYVDLGGRFVVPMELEAFPNVAASGDMRNGLAEVQIGGKRCLINARNERVLPCQFTDIGPATGALIPIRKKGKWGYANRKGTVLVDDRYDMAWEMLNGMARVKNGEMLGVIDSTGKEVVAPRYSEINEADHGFFQIGTAAGKGLMDRAGKELIATIYGSVTVMSERIVRVERNDKMGYIQLSDGRFIWKEEGFDAPESP